MRRRDSAPQLPRYSWCHARRHLPSPPSGPGGNGCSTQKVRRTSRFTEGAQGLESVVEYFVLLFRGLIRGGVVYGDR
ncbi:hypothetical protein SGPA1_12739 [Streptomyces misionensis JCM 4497]